MQNRSQFLQPVGFVRTGRNRCLIHDIEDDALQRNDIAFVDRNLQTTDLGNKGGFTAREVLEVECLQPRDQPIAIVDQLQHILGTQVGQVQCDAIRGAQLNQAAKEFAGRQSEQGRNIRSVLNDLRISKIRILRRAQKTLQNGFKVQAIHLRHQRFIQALLLRTCRITLEAQLDNFFIQFRKELNVNEFRQMKQGSLAGFDKCQESGWINGFQGYAVCLIDRRKMPPVEGIQNLQDLLLAVFGNLAAFFHQRPDRCFRQKTEKGLGIDKPSGNPDQLHIAAAEAGGIFDADTHRDSHDFSCFQKLSGKRGLDVIVVDHAQPANSFDPGIHDQVGGGLAALGVYIVNMVVKCQMVPFFGQFQQDGSASVAFAQHGACPLP